MSDRVFEYIGGGSYRVGLPMRDLYERDMRRCAKQGWPRERIERELPGMYRPIVRVDPKERIEGEDVEEADDIAAAIEADAEYEAGETLDWNEVKDDLTDEEE